MAELVHTDCSLGVSLVGFEFTFRVILATAEFEGSCSCELVNLCSSRGTWHWRNMEIVVYVSFDGFLLFDIQ